MSEIEAIEYREKRTQIFALFVIATVSTSFGVLSNMCGVLLIEAGEITIGWLSILGGGACIFVGNMLMAVTMGEYSNNILRKVCSRIGYSYADPPLDEWRESLENRNAFPVDQYRAEND